MSNAAIDYLRGNATLGQDGRAVRLPPEQLERAFYKQVDDVLVRLGGKWNGRKRVHLFPYDVTPAYQAVLDTGILPPKNPTAFFPTPAVLVERMVELAELHDGHLVLEPSAGTGAIADAVRATGAAVHCCEVLDLNRAALERKGHILAGDDFTAYAPGPIYDAVLMNPPFSLDGDRLAYITHITHAWTLLKPGGVLIAITPTGFEYRQDRKTAEFREWLAGTGEWTLNGAGLFKESGTGIDTATIYIRKEALDWRREPYNGRPSWHAWAGELWLENQENWLRRAQQAIKAAPTDPLPTDLEAVMGEVVKDARRHGDPLDPLRSDLQAIRDSLAGALGLLGELEALLPPPAPEPVALTPAAPEPGFGPLFEVPA